MIDRITQQRVNVNLLPFLVGGINFCVLAASDIFTPALPAISKFFSISENEASKTVMVYLILMASSGLLFGPISDQIGKRKMAGMLSICLILGSIISMTAQDFSQLIVGRAIQGVGASILPITIAMMRDHIKSNYFASALSKVMMMHAIAPVFGPFIGGFIILYFTWQTNFYAIFLMCLLIASLIYFVFPKDDEAALKKEELGLKRILNDYKLLLTNKNYILFTLIAPLNFGVFWSDVTNMPFIIVNSMNLAPTIFSYYIMIGVLIYIFGNYLNQKLVLKHSLHKMLYIGIMLILIFNTLTLLIRTQMVIHPLLLPFIKAPVTIGMSFVHANSNSLALSSTRNKSGSAISLISFCQLLFSSVFVWFTTLFFNGTIYPILITAIIAAVIKLILYKMTSYNTSNS